MILTASDFLEQFKKYALSKIETEDKDIMHTVAIGDNFEGLTAELLNRAIFKDFNLKMVERSFIFNDSGIVSDELDCLLVIGEGQKMSFANRYKYHVKDVIAVFQVKKNLYADAIDNSHKNLLSVIEVSEPRDPDSSIGRILRDAYKTLTSKEIPSKERRERFTDRENIIYNYLIMEAFHPLRIVIGYYGYTTEYGMREGFVKKLEQTVKDAPVKGYSPMSFPSLIICGNNSIIKNNGMPGGIPFSNDEFYFHILTSSSGRTMYHLLELIWTRLSYRFEISSSIFGDDYNIEIVHPFISCRERMINNENWGWEFRYIPLTRKQLSEPLTPIQWEPTEIDTAKLTILTILSQVGTIDLNADKHFVEFINDDNANGNQLIKDLVNARLVYIDEGKLGLLVDELMTHITPEGKIFAGENKSGEMTNFITKNVLKKTGNTGENDK